MLIHHEFSQGRICTGSFKVKEKYSGTIKQKSNCKARRERS